MLNIKQSVVLTKVGNLYDISIDSVGDIESEDSFDSIIITSLFTDARADKNQVVDPSRRRGWIGNVVGEFILGSTIWVYGQLRNRKIEFQEIASAALFSLQHLKDDNRANSINAKMDLDNGKAVLDILIKRPDNKADHRFFDLWENTGTRISSSYIRNFPDPGSGILPPIPSNHAINFSVGNNRMSTPSNQNLNFANEWSFSTWWKPTASGNQSPFEITNEVNDINRIKLLQTSSGKFRFQITNLTGSPVKTYDIIPILPLSINQWYNIGGTWDGTDLRLWLDGVEAIEFGSPRLEKTQDNPVTQTSTARTIRIGTTINNFGISYSLALWASVLSPSEMNAIYGSGSEFDLSINQPGYSSASSNVSWYRFGAIPEVSGTLLVAKNYASLDGTPPTMQMVSDGGTPLTIADVVLDRPSGSS